MHSSTKKFFDQIHLFDGSCGWWRNQKRSLNGGRDEATLKTIQSQNKYSKRNYLSIIKQQQKHRLVNVYPIPSGPRSRASKRSSVEAISEIKIDRMV